MKPVVVAESLSKRFSRVPNSHMGYGLTELFAEIFRVNRKEISLRDDEFWAVNDVSFVLQAGESLGLIGRNGCGKTTLLKMLTGLLKPDKGKILVDGKVQALINLGAGFNPKLSGLDNIYNAASVKGFSRKQTQALVDEIIDFSELEEFIESPIGSYSSGMYARLGFSLAINLSPEVLFIDEILAVGDHAFQNKCHLKMNEIKNDGVSIVLVSHNHTQIMQLCDHALWLNSGKKVEHGPAKSVVKKYLDHLDTKKKLSGSNSVEVVTKKMEKPRLYGAIYDEYDKIKNLTFEVKNECRSKSAINVNDNVILKYRFELIFPVKDLNVSINIYRKDGMLITTISTLNGDVLNHIKKGVVSCEVTIKDLNLNPGEYIVVMPVHEGHSYLYRDVVCNLLVDKSEKMHWGMLGFEYEYKLLDV